MPPTAGPPLAPHRPRHYSSLSFGTITVPQSADVSSGEAVMNPREVARVARHAIALARERLEAGDALLLFGEGRRSRTGAMQPMLPAVARYIEGLRVSVLPVGITGTAGLFPIDAETVHPVRVTARVGPPIPASSLSGYADGDRRGMMDGIGMTIARLLPASYRGCYGA
jgi:1-acyl-sn-glycerol-3-phosphate acyltransferase